MKVKSTNLFLTFSFSFFLSFSLSLFLDSSIFVRQSGELTTSRTMIAAQVLQDEENEDPFCAIDDDHELLLRFVDIADEDNDDDDDDLDDDDGLVFREGS